MQLNPNYVKRLAWSHSTLSNIDKCKYFFARNHLVKDLPVEEDSPAMVRGSRIHKKVEKALLASDPRLKKLPPPYDVLNPYIETIEGLKQKGATVSVEIEMAVDQHWNKCGWFWDERKGDYPWGRAKADVSVHAKDKLVIIDWKTGKIKYFSDKQSKILAAVAFANYPEVQEITTCFVFFDEGGKCKTNKYTRDQIPNLMTEAFETWNEAVYCINNNLFPKEKDPFNCRFCPVVDCENNLKHMSDDEWRTHLRTESKRR